MQLNPNDIDNLTIDILKRFWNLNVSSLNRVDEEEGRCCYKAISTEAILFVKTQHDTGDFVEDLERGFRVQSYLQSNGFPTNRVCPSINDALVERFEGYGVVVEPWIDHVSFEKDLKSWNVFGQLVGQLHSVTVPNELSSCVSKMDPSWTLDKVLRQIEGSSHLVPEEFSVKFKSIQEQASKLDDLRSVSRGLIHSNLAWGNVIQDTNGHYLLIDFEGGGIGPRIMDLVEVTTYLCRGPSAFGPLQGEAAIEFYRGYRDYYRLDSSEEAVFKQAHFFHQVYYLANSLSRDDFDFINRMAARLDNWEKGVLDRLIEIAEN